MVIIIYTNNDIPKYLIQYSILSFIFSHPFEFSNIRRYVDLTPLFVNNATGISARMCAHLKETNAFFD